MNLCFINPSKSRRPEIYGLANFFPKDNEITILQPSDEKHKKEIQLSRNVVVKHFSSHFLAFGDLKITLQSIRKCFDLLSLNECDYSLVHACDYDYFTSLIPIFLKKRFNIPISIVNDALIGYNYIFGNSKIDFLANLYTCSIGKKILRYYDKIVMLYSDASYDLNSLGIPFNDISIIPNGIDAGLISKKKKLLARSELRTKYGIEEDEKLILYVGRLVGVKRVDILINLVESLLKEGIKVKAFIVGAGPQLKNLKKLSHHLSKTIVFTGFVSEEEKDEFYCISDLFILPTLSEGLPTVLLEASAWGLPIIASKTNGISDIIIDESTGFLVNKSQPQQFLHRAKILLNDESLSDKFAKNSYSHIVENFSWKKVAHEYKILFEDLIKK